MKSSSSDDDSNDNKKIQFRYMRNTKRKYGQRIPKELANLRAQANSKYVFGEIDETKRLLEIMIKKYPFYQEAYRVYGLICLDQNNVSKATNYFMLAAKRKGSTQLWLKIANLLKSQGRYDLASIYFGKVLKKNQTNIQVMWERVGCFEQSGEYSRGIQQLEKLQLLSEQLKLEDLYEECLKRMAKIYVKKNQLEEAKQCLNKLQRNDNCVNMMCEILDIEKNYEEMRQLLDSVFGNKTMTEILKQHDYRIICFYILCGFNDYQQIVEYYQDNQQAISQLIEMTEKIDKKESLLEILYEYRNSFDKTIKDQILIKYANYVDHSQQQSEVPDEPEQLNNKDQIIFIYNRLIGALDEPLQHTSNLIQYFLKILSYEQKSIYKQQRLHQIKKEEASYLFGKQKKKKKMVKFIQQNTQNSISIYIGYEKFFQLASRVFQVLLENDLSQELFEVTYKMYQLRLKKIAKDNTQAYLNFMDELATHGLWASLKEKQFLIAPIYLRYIKNQEILLQLIQIIYKNIAPEQKGIVNSFTRSLDCYAQSILPMNIEHLLQLHKQKPKDALLNLIISLQYLQIMSGRLAFNQEDWMKKTLYYFDQYRLNSEDQLEIQYNLGRIYLHLNVVNKGIEIMEKIVTNDITHPVVYKAGFCLMQIHKKLGNQDKALYYLRKYNKLS